MQNSNESLRYHAFWGEHLSRISLEEHVRYTLRAAILTRQGELKKDPNLGSRITDFLFRPLTPALRSEISTHIREVIENAEPRIEVRSVEVGTDKSISFEMSEGYGTGRLNVHICYFVRSTNRQDRLKLSL